MDLVRNAPPKPLKGTALMARKERRKKLVSDEDANKAIVRRRDRHCRYPDCVYCRRYRDLVPEAAHVLQAKGMSGDRTLIRSQSNQMMLLDPLTHALQERHDIDVRPVDPALGTDGPCEFWRRGLDGVMYLVAREIAPFVYERD